MSLLIKDAGSADPEVVAGRYEILTRLARGGMGEVFRARDRALGREVALKRLIVGDDARRRTRMFEREFYTLAALKHPRIIEVYDYGIDARGAFYTMELLDGRDLRELAPLPWLTACRCLRDVAGSLALLHARNLLHRDVSPRNVRLTSDGRAKLLDFGALSSFGRHPTVVGTAPGVPPEAVHGEPLDQRADLYALGALGYWLLTGKHAFDVRNVGQLAEAWQTAPAPPSELAPPAPSSTESAGIPRELDELILGLLSRNRQARPVNAAEVIARLVSIAQLEAEDESFALSYFHGSPTVGRARERAKLRRRVKAVLRGRGALVAIEAETGMGCGRLLSDLALEARLRGATAVVVDASAQRGAYGVIAPIAHALLIAHPAIARAALGAHASTLARFLPEGSRDTQPVKTSPAARGGDPRENRLRVQSALLAWLIELANHVPLVIAVHHADHADDSSAALLSALAHGIEQRRLLLVLSHDPGVAHGAAQHPWPSAERLQLRGLSRDEVHALVEATFGPARHAERLAASLHELTAGKPQGCLDVMQHLVEIGVIRFIESAWVLPQVLSADELPADLDQALELNLARSSPAARQLACAISVHRGSLPLDRCFALAKLERIEEPRALLAELQRRGLIVLEQDALRFSHARVRDALSHQLAPDQRSRLHARFGTLIASEDSHDAETRLDAGWHLLHGGQERKGAQMLAELGVELSLDADSIPSALPALQAALVIYRKLNMPAREQANLLGAITAAAFFSDRGLFERYVDQTITVMQGALGLTLASQLRGWIGARASTWLGLCSGFFGYLFAYGPTRAYAQFSRAVAFFTTIATSVVSHAALTLDIERARAGAMLVEPLRALGANHGASWLAELLLTLSQVPQDRVAQTAAAFERLAARGADPKPIAGLSSGERTLLQMVTLYAWGALETFRENPEALRIADRLEQLGLKLAELFADQIRANYYGLRGQVALQQHYVQQVELFSLQAGSVWLAEIWAPTSMVLGYNATGDVAGLQRCLGEIERLAEDIPSLQLHVQLARATYYYTCGDYPNADRVGAPTVENCEPRAYIGWTASMAGHIAVTRELGNPEKSRALALHVLSLLDADDYTVTTMVNPVIIQLALTEARLGDLDGAGLRIDEALEALPSTVGPVTRGNLHEARSRIAREAGDWPLARLHQQHMRRAFLPTENPALIGRSERLARELEAGSDDSTGSSLQRDLGLNPSSVAGVRAQLERCTSAAERCELALSLALDHCAGDSGFLFTWSGDALRWVAPLKLRAPGPRVERCVRAAIQRFAVADSQVTSVERGVSATDPADDYRVFLLTAPDRESSGIDKVVGAVAVGRSLDMVRVPSRALLEVLALGISEPTSITATSETQQWHVTNKPDDSDR